MAKQLGNNPLSGKVDNIVYYTTKDGQRLARRAYEHTGKKVKTSPAYTLVRKNNQLFGANSWFARRIYNTLKSKLPHAVPGSFFNQFMKYTAENPSGFAGPKAISEIVPWVNGQLLNSSFIDLPSQAPNNAIKVSNNQVNFGTAIVLPRAICAELKNKGIDYIDFKVFAIASGVPFPETYTTYEFYPMQVQQLRADTDVQISASSDAVLIPANTTIALSGVSASSLCNYNGGSDSNFGGVFVWVGAQNDLSTYHPDYCCASYIVPYYNS